MVRKKAQRAGLTNVATILTNCHTGLDENSIDVIICFDMFHHIKDQREMLKEFHRVLKSNSIFSLDCHHMDDIQSRVEGSGLFKFMERKGETYYFEKI